MWCKWHSIQKIPTHLQVHLLIGLLRYFYDGKIELRGALYVWQHSNMLFYLFFQIWNLGSPDPNFTLDAHQKGVNCVDYFTGGDKPYLITGSDDHTAKVLLKLPHFLVFAWLCIDDLETLTHFWTQVWDYQTKSCVQTLEGHTHNVSAVCFHPDLPIIITGSEDGTVRIWHSTTYR